MEISLIYVLVTAEALLILLGLCITLFVLLIRKPKTTEPQSGQPTEEAESELDAIDLGNSYIDFLEQAMERNTNKLKQQESIEADEAHEASEESDDLETSPAPDETQSMLLQAREQFLLSEKAAAEKSEHEIHFWDSIYDGMKNLLELYKSTETIVETEVNTEVVVDHQTESKEKVFYIETQGKKIDGEVNKLKDIIYEQENALSSLKKALGSAEDEHPEESESLSAIKEQLVALERQLADSKMCMEVLEMENDRLQEEVDKIDARHETLFEESDTDKEESGSMIDIDQIKEVVEDQEAKINQLVETIESLEIEASQAEKLKETISGFAQTSKEMMGCISILEEENERLQAASNTEEAAEANDTSTASNEETDTMKSKINELEEEIIKKDVAFAKLQDEFSSMETEYLAMYEAMHGDNS